VTLTFPRPPRGAILLMDAALLGWIVAWIILAGAVAREVDGLTRLSGTVVLAGGALEQTGDLLGSFDRVPFLGDQVGEVSEQIRRTGRSARRNAAASRESIENLSVLLGVSIALIPTLPLLGVYLPLRVRWRRERRAIRRALRRRDGAPMLEQYLARRAVQTLPYDRLRAISADPWRDVAEGRFTVLADAELARLGLRRPARADPA
jgi:hypothetical protein